MLIKLDDCNPPATFYLTVFSILYAFTHQLMFATDDFKALYIRSNSRLSHIMFDV